MLTLCNEIESELVLPCSHTLLRDVASAQTRQFNWLPAGAIPADVSAPSPRRNGLPITILGNLLPANLRGPCEYIVTNERISFGFADTHSGRSGHKAFDVRMAFAREEEMRLRNRANTIDITAKYMIVLERILQRKASEPHG